MHVCTHINTYTQDPYSIFFDSCLHARTKVCFVDNMKSYNSLKKFIKHYIFLRSTFIMNRNDSEKYPVDSIKAKPKGKGMSSF